MASVRIGNCSGFFGDRLSAAAEMVRDGPIDYLTGDYLAELTMALLWRSRQKDPDGGYARTFLTQMEQVMADCLSRGIRVVVNAGGLNPGGLARDLRSLANRLGATPRIATVEGDDLMGRLDEVDLRSFAEGLPMAESEITPITANAYLGCWGIVDALERGADIVVTGRVTDASLVMGPAAHHFGWARDDWDRLAGALVAGHVIECGAQATGGNYAFFDEVDGLDHVGFPLVEMEEDGSFTVTKHPGTGGLVSVGTVTAQLLYEIGGHRYPNPDVTARFDTIVLDHAGPDRVSISAVKGEPPPSRLKVAVNYLGGYQNQITFVLTGLDIEKKAEAAEAALWRAIGGRGQVASAHVELIRWDRPDARTNNEAMAHLRITVKDADPERVGRRFSGAAVETALASYPGLFATGPPRDASPFAVYWPATVDRARVPALVTIDDQTTEVRSVSSTTSDDLDDVALTPNADIADYVTEEAPLGRLAGARSGDKGGDANVGFWVRDSDAFDWLNANLTIDLLRSLLPEAADLVIERHRFPNLSALNFVVKGLLDEGAASSPRVDPQAKSLGEFLRSRLLCVPVEFLGPVRRAVGGDDAGTISNDA